MDIDDDMEILRGAIPLQQKSPSPNLNGLEANVKVDIRQIWVWYVAYFNRTFETVTQVRGTHGKV